MRESLSSAGRRAIALLVLLLAAYVLFKVVLAVATAVVWIAVVIIAIAAIVWAIRVL
jgi:hypothetical protein